MPDLDELRRSRYALLRTYRRDGTAVDTPIWFALEGRTLVFRTKIGPKTTRLTRNPRVALRVCNHQGGVKPGASTLAGHATVLEGAAADQANDALRRRYGWQYNIVPLLKLPGVNNVDSALPWRQKLRRVRDRGVWDGSALVRVDL